MSIYNADTGRFGTFGYGQINFKYMPGGCRSDLGFHLIHVGLDFLLLTGCYSCNYFKERFRIACDHTRAQSSCNSPHAACIGNDDAFYIFDNISTYFNIQLFRQIAQSFSRHCSCIGNGNGFGTSHCRNQFFLQDFYVSLVFFITFVQCFLLAFAQQYEYFSTLSS